MQDRWGRLTDDDLALAQAGRNALDWLRAVALPASIRTLAERHVDDWLTSFG